MIDEELDATLRDRLHAQAATVAVAPALDEVRRRVAHRRRQLRIASTVAVVAAAAVLVAALVPAARRDAGSAADDGELPGLLLAPTAPIGPTPAGRTLDRVDPPSAAWSVVLRAEDGELALRSAVVTFPVATVLGGEPVRVGDADGRLAARSVTWPVAGGYARVRSDLPRDVVLAVARATTIVDGRPTVAKVAGLRAVYRGVFDSGTQRESRYGAEEFDETGALGNGLVFGGTLRGAAIEDLLLATDDRRAPLAVNGRRALRWDIANGALVWEVRPGVQAFVGWSGAEQDDDAWAAVVRIAERATLVGAAEWAATEPGPSSGGTVSMTD